VYKVPFDKRGTILTRTPPPARQKQHFASLLTFSDTVVVHLNGMGAPRRSPLKRSASWSRLPLNFRRCHPNRRSCRHLPSQNEKAMERKCETRVPIAHTPRHGGVDRAPGATHAGVDRAPPPAHDHHMVRFVSPPPPPACRHHPSGTKSLWLLRARVLGVPHTVSPRYALPCRPYDKGFGRCRECSLRVLHVAP